MIAQAFETLLLLLGLPFVFLAAGYGLAARLRQVAAGERLAVASLAGPALLIWNVSLLAFFHPIAGLGAWLCLWPIVWTLLDRTARTALVADLAFSLHSRRAWLAVAGGALFLFILLWPAFSQPGLVFYDGSSNHDSFFWVSGAEQLKAHTYMVEPVKSPTQPFFNGVGVLAGWKPMWGRMGGEGLLALLSVILGVAPLKLYVVATAALFIPWVAATFLVARTFLVPRLTTPALLALVALQPLFVFFHGNANLPNLLGVVTGALVVVATVRSLRADAGADRVLWLVLLALSFHGLLCSYPEMVPFIVLPGGLLWLRSAFNGRARPAWGILAATFAAYLAGLALNPVTTCRAWYGFIASFLATRADIIWINIFQLVSPSNYVPGLLTMNLRTSAHFTAAVTWLFSFLLLAALIAVFCRARDRIGAWLMMSGAGLLLTYTIITGFNYGWQKTAQVGGVFTAALLPVAAIDLFSRPVASRHLRFLLRLSLAGLAAFFAYATARNIYVCYQWSDRKALTSDWLDLHNYTRAHYANAPVLVDAASFRWAFFHSMWAIYFLRESHPVFTARSPQNGGYLRDYIRLEPSPPDPSLPVLVSADWAASWDANSPRLLAGPAITLLSASNRVTAMTGFSPESGPPELAANALSVTIRPHHASRLIMELAPQPLLPASLSAHWKIRAAVPGAPIYEADLNGPPPWRLTAPLIAGRANEITFTNDASTDPALPLPFTVRAVRVENAP